MRVLTDAVLAELRTSAFSIGDAIKPDGVAAGEPWAVLFPLDPDGREGDMRDLQVTGWWEWQIASVGYTREQAELVADTLREQLTSTELTPTGYVLGPWQLSIQGVVSRDDDVKPPLFYVLDVVQGFVSPTS